MPPKTKATPEEVAEEKGHSVTPNLEEIHTFDGTKEEIQEKINEANLAIQQELERWKAIKAHPSNIHPDGFLIDAYLNSLVAYLVETGVVNDEQFTLFFKERLMVTLQQARQAIEGVQSEMIRKDITRGVHPPAIQLPFEKPTKFH